MILRQSKYIYIVHVDVTQYQKLLQLFVILYTVLKGDISMVKSIKNELATPTYMYM